jgi:hypothetical protein
MGEKLLLMKLIVAQVVKKFLTMNRNRGYSHIHTSFPPSGPYPEPDDSIFMNQAIKEDSAWTARPVKMGSTGSTETSVTINQLTLRNIPEEPRPQTRPDESLKCHRLRFPTSQPITSRPILILSFHPRLVFSLYPIFRPAFCTHA